jgi:hypothetical protein
MYDNELPMGITAQIVRFCSALNYIECKLKDPPCNIITAGDCVYCQLRQYSASSFSLFHFTTDLRFGGPIHTSPSPPPPPPSFPEYNEPPPHFFSNEFWTYQIQPDL